MERARMLQMAELVMDATDMFRKAGVPHNVELAVGEHPEIWLHENVGRPNDKCFRYQSYVILATDKHDPNLEKAEAHIKRLMEEVLENDTVRDDGRLQGIA